MSNLAPPDLVVAAVDLQATKLFQVAAIVFLAYDMLITFGDEVERIWKQPWSFTTFLYGLNRYLALFVFIVIVVSFQSKAWTENISACEHYYRYDGASTLVLVAVSEAIMMLRVYAIWQRNRYILILLSTLWVGQVAICGMGLAFTSRLPLPPGFVACIDTGVGKLFTPFWFMPLISDTFVFFLTLWRNRQYSRMNANLPLMQLFVRDGALYFLVIFSANLLNVTLYLSAPDSLKNITAGFSQTITPVMVSRLVLNLRNHHADRFNDAYPVSAGIGNWVVNANPKKSFFETMTTLGPLGDQSHMPDTTEYPSSGTGPRDTDIKHTMTFEEPVALTTFE